MTKMPSMACFDARLQQAHDDERFSWSGICKRGNIGTRAHILAYANDNQWARAEKKSRLSKLSRRIEWRNSLWPQRFWCPLSRQPVHVSPRNLCSISSRSRRRFMLSRPRARANTADTELRQNSGSASDATGENRLQTCAVRRSTADYSLHEFSLWSNENPSATVLVLYSRKACTESRLISLILTKTDNRSFQCQNRPSLLLSVQSWFSQHVHGRHPNQSQHPCQSQSSWSRQATKADAQNSSGQAFGSDPYTARPSGIEGGQKC